LSRVVVAGGNHAATAALVLAHDLVRRVDTRRITIEQEIHSMRRKFAAAIATTLLTAGIVTPGLSTQAAAAGVDAGILTCNVDSGWGFVFGSSRNLRCVYSPRPGVAEHYVGNIDKFGVDIGYLQNAVIIWAVVAPTVQQSPGALAGVYGGVTGGATVGVGADANVLIGGSTHSISLQPLSIAGNKGLNVAAGIASINLHYESQSPS
jgi:hypothetical protein